MATTKQQSIFLLLAFVTLSSIIISSNADDCGSSGTMAVYWGQGAISDEGTLEELCATGYYNIVILQFLTVWVNGTLELDLGNHCGKLGYPPCSELQSQIEYCQRNNIKVFLSIVQAKEPSLTRGLYNKGATSLSEDVTKEFANYVLKNYLSGKPGPLGSVYLDGIDFWGTSNCKFLKGDGLVKALIASTRRIYISAFPQCVYPDEYLDDAIQTGLVDYIWVDFNFNETCKYSNGDATNLLNAWKTWTSSVPNSSIFLGVSSYDEPDSYIPPDALKYEVLPIAKKASNYGGVMIWYWFYDKSNSYTTQIKDSVPKICKCVCDEPSSTNFYGMHHVSLPNVGSI